MKVMYIGNYRDGTGWSQAAIDYILALDVAGVDVVPRHIKLNNRTVKLPDRILELEKKSAKNCDTVIQNVLPHLMDYNGDMFNVGLFYSETSDFKNCSWPERLNEMDMLIVPNDEQAWSTLRSRVKTSTHIVPIPTDISKFQRSYTELECLKKYKEQGSFLFYFIGEMVKRKNLAALLKAFHLEFEPSENVELVIKTDKPGISNEECKKHVEKFCGDIKRGLKIHGENLDNYKEEIILTDRFTDEGIMKLHSTCDCFVMPSYGEAWSIPTFEAMAMGKTPIVSACSGFLDYISRENGYLVETHEEPVFGEVDTFKDLFVGREYWNAIDIKRLRKFMRKAYEEETDRINKANRGIEDAYNFSYDVVGPKLREVLINERTKKGLST